MSEIQRQCAATVARTGERCKRAAAVGDNQTHCAAHGGVSVGEAGRYFDHLNAEHQATFAEAATDPQLLRLEHDLSLLHVLLIQAYARMNEGSASAADWREAQFAANEVEHSRQRRDYVALDRALERLRRVLGDAVTHIKSGEEIERLLALRERVVKQCYARKDYSGEWIQRDEVIPIWDALKEAIINHVDQQTRQKISEDFKNAVEGLKPAASADAFKLIESK